MILIKGTLQDLPELQSIFIQTIHAVCSTDYTSEQIQAWAAGADNHSKWEDILNQQVVLVAEMDNQAVGFASLHQGHLIDLLYVHHRHQRKGIAQRLLQALEAEAINQRQATITAFVSKTALPFFTANSFVIIGEQANFRQGILIENYHMKKSL